MSNYSKFSSASQVFKVLLSFDREDLDTIVVSLSDLMDEEAELKQKAESLLQLVGVIVKRTESETDDKIVDVLQAVLESDQAWMLIELVLGSIMNPRVASSEWSQDLEKAYQGNPIMGLGGRRDKEAGAIPWVLILTAGVELFKFLRENDYIDNLTVPMLMAACPGRDDCDDCDKDDCDKDDCPEGEAN